MLATQLVGRSFSGIRVLSADVSWSGNPDAEAPSLTVKLTVSDPDPVAGTWELVAADEVRNAARELVAQQPAVVDGLAVTLVPEHPDFGDDADA